MQEPPEDPDSRHRSRSSRQPSPRSRTASFKNRETKNRNPFKSRSSNPWLDQDRQEQRHLVATGVFFALAAVGGLVWLIYALVTG